MVSLTRLLIVFGALYGFAMLGLSRREPSQKTGRAERGGRRRVGKLFGTRDDSWSDRPSAPAPTSDRSQPFFVFLLPCLNEERVIRQSLEALLSAAGEQAVALVIDDDSDDNTAGVVRELADSRVAVLSRRRPDARQGKGEALNAAVRYVTASGLCDGHAESDVIVVVVDADGRLDPSALDAVTPFFADPQVGAVQIGVRINNRHLSRLARMQDMEFVIYTEVFQRGRRHFGSVGLGGNGQFIRLSALRCLGETPWSRSLTDDLDLGVRLLAAGWRNEYCRLAAVHQQGVVEIKRLIRQRSRWFQGHLQSWRLIPTVLRSVDRRARGDLLYHLTSPALLLATSLLSASFALALVNIAVLACEGRDPLGWWLASAYALTFGPALAMSYVYWLTERVEGVGALRVVGLAHLYVFYTLMWYPAGWWAVARTVRRKTGWAKTARVLEPTTSTPAIASPAERERAGVGATGRTADRVAEVVAVGDEEGRNLPLSSARPRPQPLAPYLVPFAVDGMESLEKEVAELLDAGRLGRARNVPSGVSLVRLHDSLCPCCDPLFVDAKDASPARFADLVRPSAWRDAAEAASAATSSVAGTDPARAMQEACDTANQLARLRPDVARKMRRRVYRALPFLSSELVWRSNGTVLADDRATPVAANGGNHRGPVRAPILAGSNGGVVAVVHAHSGVPRSDGSWQRAAAGELHRSPLRQIIVREIQVLRRDDGAFQARHPESGRTALAGRRQDAVTRCVNSAMSYYASAGQSKTVERLLALHAYVVAIRPDLCPLGPIASALLVRRARPRAQSPVMAERSR